MSATPAIKTLRSWKEEFPTQPALLLRADQVTERPTVFIGLGGTGCKSVAAIRRQFQEHFPEHVPECFQFRAFDTDTSIKYRELDLGEHLHHITVFQPTEFAKGLREGPHAQTWIHEDFSAENMTSGAGGFRARGRLAFFFNATMISEAVSAALQAARGYASVRPNFQPGRPKVYLFGSLAGGTASGAVLDLAFLLRYMEQEVHISAFLGLFGPFRSTMTVRQAYRARAGVAAALKEIEAFMRMAPEAMGEGDDRLIHYKTGIVGRKTVPFNVCHLFEDKNEKEIGLISDPLTLSEMMARAAFLEVCSPKEGGENLESAFDDIGDCLLEFDRLGHPTCFSTLGVARLYYDRDLVGHAMAFTCLKRLVDRYLDDQVDSRDDVKRLESALSVDAGSLRRDLILKGHVKDAKTGVETDEYVPVPNYNAVLKALLQDIKGASARKQLPELAEKAEKESAGEIGVKLAENRPRALAARWAGIEKVVNDVLAGPGAGCVKRARDVLSAARLRVSAALANALADLEQADALRENRSKQLAEVKKEILDATTSDSWFEAIDDALHKRERVQHITWGINEMAKASYEVAVRQAARDLLAALLARIDDLAASIRDDLGEKLKLAGNLFEDQAHDRLAKIAGLYEKAGKEARVLHVHVLSKEHVEKLCDVAVLSPDALAGVLSGTPRCGLKGVLETLAALKKVSTAGAATLENPVELVASLVYDGLYDTLNDAIPVALEDALGKAGEEDASVVTRLARLYDLFAAPQIDLRNRQNAMGEEYEKLAAVSGVPERLQDRLAGTLQSRRVTRMGTLSRQSIDILREFHGYSLRAISHLEYDYIQHYRTYVRELRKLSDGKLEVSYIHTFPDSDMWPDSVDSLRTDDDGELGAFARLWALGVIFPPTAEEKKRLGGGSIKDPGDFIYTVGRQHFYYQPFYVRGAVETPAVPVLLGQGVVAAIAAARKSAQFREQAPRWLEYGEQVQRRDLSAKEFICRLDTFLGMLQQQADAARRAEEIERADLLRRMGESLCAYKAEFA